MVYQRTLLRRFLRLLPRKGLFYSGFPLNAPNASSRALAPHYLKNGSLNKAVSSGFLEKYRLLLSDEK